MTPPSSLADWFARQGWEPLPFQQAAWAAFADGRSGLLHAPTGAGKTLAAWGGPLQAFLDLPVVDDDGLAPPQVLWITPLRALATDTERALRRPVDDLGVPWSLARRTGDTSSAKKKQIRTRLPSALVTTPESLSLLLSYPRTSEQLGSLQAVVVDEWHELLGSKRGTLTELALAHVRAVAPSVRTWGISATLGNLDEARNALLGPGHVDAPIITAALDRPLRVDTIRPTTIERFPWAGHLGTALTEAVAEALDPVASALVFVNTRSQAERWYQALLAARPAWAGRMAVHHGALARPVRRFVESALADGRLKCVVCTSTLDLGVDFPPVDHVVQIGSAKGVGRLLQRGGRAHHRPGEPAAVTLVPTHAFELLEAAAARALADTRTIEPRRPLNKPLDVLAQHVVTIAAGDGFEGDDLFDEVRATWAYRHLTRSEWAWILRFAEQGGDALYAYDEYKRITFFRGRWRAASSDAVRRHRMSIGVIVGDADIRLKYRRGQNVGSVPESFLARLNPGDVFLFAGKALELVRMRDDIAYVRRAASARGAVPRYGGSLLPLSRTLADGVRLTLDAVARGVARGPELDTLAPLFALQRRWSHLPRADELLVEAFRTREGHHLVVYPFAGRLVHEGLAALVALRLGRRQPRTFSLAANEYGFELLSADPVPFGPDAAAAAFTDDDLLNDLDAVLNEAELAKRQFREIARIAGLVFSGPRGGNRRHLQAHAGLIYEVLRDYEPDNLFLAQARQEVLDRQLDLDRLAETLGRARAGRLVVTTPPQPTPFAFPILTNRLREKVSSEKAAARIQRMVARYERAADRRP